MSAQTRQALAHALNVDKRIRFLQALSQEIEGFHQVQTFKNLLVDSAPGTRTSRNPRYTSGNMPADPQWFANDVAIVAAVISVIALGVSGMSVWHARRQAKAGERQAGAGEEAVRLQAEALKSSTEHTARALAIAKENGDAAKAAAEALQAQAEDTHRALEIARQSADAADRLAATNETLAISGQRGWLVLMEANGAAGHTEHSKVVVRAEFRFTNVGKTAISGVRLRHCEQVLMDEPNDFVGLNTVYRPTIAPGASYILDLLVERSPAEFSRIKSKAERIYFFGNAGYQDVFGYSRTTYWRWALNGDELVPCEQGNKVE